MKVFECYDYKKNEYFLQYWKGVKHGIWIMILGIILLTIGLNLCYGAEVVAVDLDIIIACESSGNAAAISDAGAIGICQVMAGGALADWNMYHKNEQYTAEDLLNPDICIKIADWYLHKRIPQMIKAYKKPLTLENVLISYNAGISYVRYGKKLPKKTVEYIAKYKRKIAAKA